MLRKILFVSVALMIALFSGLLAAGDSDPHGRWLGPSLSQPPIRRPLSKPSPDVDSRPYYRREWELDAQLGIAHKLCPSRVDACDSQLGASFLLRGFNRSHPHFSWGVTLSDARFVEKLSASGTWLQLADRATAATLGARLHPLTSGAFDPYVASGFGGGRFAERGHLSDGTSELEIDDATIAPLLRTGAGLDVYMIRGMRIGAHFHWTHWLLSSRERCGGVAFGVCTLPSYGHFDVNNAVWSWHFGASLLFGGRH